MVLLELFLPLGVRVDIGEVMEAIRAGILSFFKFSNTFFGLNSLLVVLCYSLATIGCPSMEKK